MGCGCKEAEKSDARTVVAADRRGLFEALFTEGGRIVEVGSQKGVSAKQIVEACSPSLLVLIDPWRFLPGEYERDPANRPTPRREAEMAECRERVGQHPHVAMVRALSHEAAPLFADGSLDAVYLDADHTRAAIAADIGRWWPKVRSGGVLSGHDYTTKLPWAEVKPVVDGWVKRQGLELLVTAEKEPADVTRPHPDVDGCVFASWATRKP